MVARRASDKAQRALTRSFSGRPGFVAQATAAVERDRWLTREEADRLISVCPGDLAALVKFALATGCRAREITGLEWERVDLVRQTAWLNQTKNGMPRGVPLNRDAVAVLEQQRGKHDRSCFTFRGRPIRWQISDKIWRRAVKEAGIADRTPHRKWRG